MSVPTYKIDDNLLELVKGSSMNYPTTRWAVYQNMALDSMGAGLVTCLAIGPENTYQEPPESLPYKWKYCFIGWVEQDTQKA